MNNLNSIITYVRRIVKTPSNTSLSDNLIIDYINRFWINDVDPMMQLFDFKKTYQFITIPGFDKYNMPYYESVREGVEGDPSTTQLISRYPKYQGFFDPCAVNGQKVRFFTEKNNFFNLNPDSPQYFPSIIQGTGVGNYNIQIPSISPSSSAGFAPYNQVLLRGHLNTSEQASFPPTYNSSSTGGIVKSANLESKVFITSQLTNSFVANISNNMVDSGRFFNNNLNIGALVIWIDGANSLSIGNSGDSQHSTVDYTSGLIQIKNQNLTGPVNVQCYYAQSGIPRSVLFYDNTLTFRPVPDNAYAVNIEAYLTPAAFIGLETYMPFGYMNEYIARGAARKILADTGDVEQLNFNEPFFKEQQILVWKRSQRQWTTTRTQTIYSQGISAWISNSNFGGNN